MPDEVKTIDQIKADIKDLEKSQKGEKNKVLKIQMAKNLKELKADLKKAENEADAAAAKAREKTGDKDRAVSFEFSKDIGYMGDGEPKCPKCGSSRMCRSIKGPEAGQYQCASCKWKSKNRYNKEAGKIPVIMGKK